MARTQGYGNPNWNRDETILALDLYHDLNGQIPDKGDARVVALSQLLRRLPYHQSSNKTDSFRNPDSVAFKLQNIKQCATGRGLKHASKTDHNVWDELGRFPDKTKNLASLIISAANDIGDHVLDLEDFEFSEGRLVTAVHLRRERNPKVRMRFLDSRRKMNALTCDMCRKGPPAMNPIYAAAHFETHHVVPMSDTGMRVTKPGDLALLCANYHRLLHRAIARERRWLSVADGKAICKV